MKFLGHVIAHAPALVTSARFDEGQDVCVVFRLRKHFGEGRAIFDGQQPHAAMQCKAMQGRRHDTTR